jgi:phosphoribosylaminoimidazole-succinocarboxamide synthase
VREWLIQNEFMGKEGQKVPEMSDTWVETISNKYIELYEKLTGQKFEPMQLEDEEVYGRIVEALNAMDLHTR